MVLTYDRKQLLSEKKVSFSRLAGHVFRRVQITTVKNYDQKKKRTGQLETGKNYIRKKKVQSSLEVVVGWMEGKTQNTTHIIDTTTNKMSIAAILCAYLSVHAYR
jgi:hypothetical protein